MCGENIGVKENHVDLGRGCMDKATSNSVHDTVAQIKEGVSALQSTAEVAQEEDLDLVFLDPKRKRVGLVASAQLNKTATEVGSSSILDGSIPKNLGMAGTAEQAR